jgi:plasmid stability protein
VSNRTLDASRAALDLSGKPRLANVAYAPADPSGRVAVSFDVTTRYTVVGKPEDQAVANLLVSLVSGAAGSEGAKGKALDLMSEGTRGGAPVSPEIVALLRRTLETDKNPGVRKKAAEALAQMPPTAETRDALAAALKNDTNPAVRILAVEGLAKAAAVLKDASSIESLRQKAADDRENGYVRSQAALALSKIEI